MTKAVSQLWNLSQDEALREYTQALEKQEMDRISDKNGACSCSMLATRPYSIIKFIEKQKPLIKAL